MIGPLLAVGVFNTFSFMAISYGIFEKGFTPWYFLLWKVATLLHGAISKTIVDK
jgi:hypothetical protein